MELPFIIKSALVLLLFYSVYTLFLKKETLFSHNRYFLLFGMLTAIILPLVVYTQTVWVDIAPTLTNSLIIEEIPILESTIIEEASIKEPFPWTTLFWVIYLVGIVLMILRFLFQIATLVQILWKYPSRKEGAFNIIETHTAIAPFSFFNYIVYNPKQHSDTELVMILQHEKNHARLYHSIDIILSNLFIVVQWFNPFAWQYHKKIVENLEFMADQTTVQEVSSAQAYQLALVKASSAYQAPVLGNSFYKSFIKKRIIMLNKSNSKKRNSLKAIIVLPLLALFLYSFNIKEEVKYREVPSDSETIQTQNEEFSNAEMPMTNSESIKAQNPVANKDNVLKNSKLVSNNVTESPLALNSQNIASYDLEALAVLPIGNPAAIKENPRNNKVFTRTLKKIEFIINKNTTNEELDEIKAVLKKEHGIDLSYTVVRNSAGEITSLGIQYTGEGNNGSYQISDDEDGINEVIFYMNDEGRMGFYSQELEERRLERMEERRARMEERREKRVEEMEERRGKMEERKEALKIRMLEREKELEKAKRKRFENVSKLIIQDSDEGVTPLYIINGEVATKEELSIINPKRIASINVLKNESAEAAYGAQGKNGVVEVVTINGSVGSVDNVFVYRTNDNERNEILITKNTTDQKLDAIKERLAAKNISFKHKGVKRNDNGEITNIKIQYNNNRGSKFTKHIRSTENDPIDPILLEF